MDCHYAYKKTQQKQNAVLICPRLEKQSQLKDAKFALSSQWGPQNINEQGEKKAPKMQKRKLIL